MHRPSISLACILKNERHNIDQLLSSVKDCFDEIHFTDTGSTDGSIELLQGYKESSPAGSPITLHHFKWINDFAAARQASFDVCKTDYIMWMDLDDVLSDAEAFKGFRDRIMVTSDFWIATYHYALTKEGVPFCSFARERVVKRSRGFKWNYFVHEGMTPNPTVDKEPVSINLVAGWSVIHKRTDEDIKQDKRRNISLFDSRKDSLEPRMQYYYGKEFYENNDPLSSYIWLSRSLSSEQMEPHDRAMALQYACFSLMQLNQLQKAIDLAMTGLQLMPLRAEFHVIVADCYAKLDKPAQAKPFYMAATACSFDDNTAIGTALYSDKQFYGKYPCSQLAKIFFNENNHSQAKHYARKCLEYSADPESYALLTQIENMEKINEMPFIHTKAPVDDILISCHPTGFYEWDEEIYKERGIGGSETAVVEMARHLHNKTGRTVKIFNNRDKAKILDGVEYLPAKILHEYVSFKKPKAHIAWRHNIKFTDPEITYIWNHDLGFGGLQAQQNFKKSLALSQFHKEFQRAFFGVPESKIIVTSNGINPEKFKFNNCAKEPGKIVWSSSPDRGLKEAMLVMDEVVKERPDAKLHVYYGFDNISKLGKNDVVYEFQQMIQQRPYVLYHGNVAQTALMQELASAEVWLYPTNFQETYCITAIEMLCSKVFPVVRNWGALPDTLGDFGDILDFECRTTGEVKQYAKHVLSALNEYKWQTINVNPEKYSWEKVADQWIEFLELKS